MNRGNFRYLETMVICYRYLNVWLFDEVEKIKEESSLPFFFFFSFFLRKKPKSNSEKAMTRNLNNLVIC